MRCKICDSRDAEFHDKRDDTYLCDGCCSDVQSIVFQWEEDNPTDKEEALTIEDTSGLP